MINYGDTQPITEIHFVGIERDARIGNAAARIEMCQGGPRAYLGI
jgi:hypothetical protein